MEIIISFVIYYTPYVNSYFEECGEGKAKTLYGAGIHLLDIIKTGGTNFEENIENTIRRYNATFTRTNQVTFSSLSQNEDYLCPPMPSTKPGSRHHEKRLR